MLLCILEVKFLKRIKEVPKISRNAGISICSSPPSYGNGKTAEAKALQTAECFMLSIYEVTEMFRNGLIFKVIPQT